MVALIEVDEMARCLRNQCSAVNPGTLRFWGDWFGRPYDNQHRLVNCENDGQLLRLHFDGRETLSLWSPGELFIGEGKFKVNVADRLLWEWFSYGQPKMPEHLCSIEYLRVDGLVKATASHSRNQFHLSPDASSPAVELFTND